MAAINCSLSRRLLARVSIITGAAQGIGRATAVKFAQEAARVVVCDLSQTAVDETVKQCRDYGVEAVALTPLHRYTLRSDPLSR